MIPSQPKSLLLMFLLVVLLTHSLSSDSPSAYEMLEKFNFPKGILPQGVKSYRLDADGCFEVLLSDDCEFRVNGDGYLLKYRKRITGKAKSGQLRELNGVSVKILFVWIGIDEVVSSGTNLQFNVGPLSASFPKFNFKECPKCHCDSICASASAVSTGVDASLSDS